MKDTFNMNPGDFEIQAQYCDTVYDNDNQKSLCLGVLCKDCMFFGVNIVEYQQWNNKEEDLNTQDKIIKVCTDISEFLVKKNIAYGDSAINPCRIFSKSDNLEAIRVRIDDKLNRIMNGTSYPGDDDVDDLIGYLILYKVGQKMKEKS